MPTNFHLITVIKPKHCCTAIYIWPIRFMPLNRVWSGMTAMYSMYLDWVSAFGYCRLKRFGGFSAVSRSLIGLPWDWPLRFWRSFPATPD